MQLLWGAFVAFIGYLFQFFFQYLTRRFALVAVYISLFFTMTLGYIAAIHSLIAGLSIYMPSSVVMAATWFLPSNSISLLTIYFTAHTIRWVFNRNLVAAAMAANVPPGKGAAW